MTPMEMRHSRHGSIESIMATCLTCKKRVPPKEMAYLFGEQTEHSGGLGMCGDCAKAKPRRQKANKEKS